jgi:hypothetical protein
MRAPVCTHCQARVGREQHRCPECHARLGFVPELGMLCSFEDRGEAGWHPLGVSGIGVRLPCGNYGEHPICHWTVAADAPDCFCEACRCVARTPRLADAAERQRWARFGRARRELFTGLRQLGLLDSRGRPHGLPEPLFDVVDEGIRGNGTAIVQPNPTGPVLVDLARIDALSDARLFDALRRAIGLRLGLAASDSMPAPLTSRLAFDFDLAIERWDDRWVALASGGSPVTPPRWRRVTRPGQAMSGPGALA